MPLLGLDGRPTPPSEVVRRLEQIHPRLGLRCAQSPGQEGHWWMFTLRWSKEDPRWGMIQQGVMSPEDAYDSIGNLPRDAGVDEAYGYFVQSARAIRGQAERDAILARVDKWINDPFDQMKAEQVELVEEDAGKLFRTHAVTDAPRKRGRPKGAKDKTKRKARAT